LYDLKIDPEQPYHYFISVGVKTMKSETPGKIFLKHGPLKFTNDDVKRLQDACLISKDKLFPTSSRQAQEMFNVTDVVHNIWGMCMAAAANECTVHHFSSDSPFPDDFWEEFVDRANTNKFEMEKLNESKIRAGGFV
jgi:hypothetical protein